jgi:quercetin dioxygenase-like cupin family protein
VTSESPTQVRTQAASEWFTFAPGVKARCLVEDRGTALKLYRIQPGLKLGLHHHAFAELGVVLAGEGRILFDVETRTVRAGDSFFVAPGMTHGFETAGGAEETVLLNVECPPESDVAKPRSSGPSGVVRGARTGPTAPVHRPSRRARRTRRAP